MKKYLFYAVIAVMFAVAPSVFAGGGWFGHITGGGQGNSGGVDFSVSVSARHDKNGIRGQIGYVRTGQSVPDLAFHGTVSCIGSATDSEVVLTGKIKPQNDPSHSIPEGSYFVIAIKEGEAGENDRVRVYFVSDEESAGYSCIHQETSFPGFMNDGNFNIRPDKSN